MLFQQLKTYSKQSLNQLNNFQLTALSLLVICLLLILPLAVNAKSNQPEPEQTPLQLSQSYFMQGSAQWRTPNSLYQPNNKQPAEFGINYRYGPHKHSIIGELIGIWNNKKTAVYATMFYFYDPSDKTVKIDLINFDGTYGPAQVKWNGEKLMRLQASMHLPDGNKKPNRHDFHIINETQYRAISFDKNAEGKWFETRAEIWTLQQ